MMTKVITFDSDNIDIDLGTILHTYWSTYPNNTRFKVELLNNPSFVSTYTNKIYRELHFKLRIEKERFKEVVELISKNEDHFGFALSNNPKEIGDNYITQFLNLRFLSGTYKESELKIKLIEDFIHSLAYTTYKEKKDELSIFDTNFTKDKWWAH